MNCFSQTILEAPGIAAFEKKVASGGGGGGGGYTLLTHTSTTGTGSGNQTTAGINTTGAKLIVVAFARFRRTSGTASTVTDNQGNTYTVGTMYTNAFARNFVQIFYCLNPITSASHIFTGADGSDYVALSVACFSGGTPAFDFENGNNSNWSGTHIQPGSVTPSGNNQLFIAAATSGVSVSITGVDSSFTIIETGTSDGTLLKLAYKNQTTGAAENPTWTSAAGTDGSAVIDTLK
ncbi:MAG TPA: hypothetical protein VH597_00280 [Verrucomicrobiae bacterium]|nr:hypothetical protein [Verrucomicrobiae bacterium]